MASHPIVHIELSANDPNTAGDFYSKLFGWQIQALPEMDYAMFIPGEGPGGGFMRAGSEMTKAGETTVYVSTENIESSLALAEQLGGKTLLPRTEIPGMGWFALFADPTGNKVGLFSEQAQQK